MNRWLITDTHFNHKKLIDMGARPLDYQERILERWHARVFEEDIVYHLGDVIMARQSEMPQYIMGLPGSKVLVRGNHDKQSDNWYLKRGFHAVVRNLIVDDMFLTHEPAVALPTTCRFNVHGHYHNSDHHAGDHVIHPWHYLLAIENTDYAPVRFDVVRDWAKSRLVAADTYNP